MSTPAPSIMNTQFTISLSKYSCMVEFYYAHVFFAYLVMIAGIGCLITRVVNPLKWMHVWFGKLYWIAMIWATGTSLLIHNTGLPTGVLISFAFVLGGMSIAWILIAFHQQHMQTSAANNVAQRIKVSGDIPTDLQRAINIEKGQIANAKTLRQRLFSYKALHGALMVVSWVNIIGRVFITKLSNDFTCSTYPYYKQVDSKDFAGLNAPLTPVPEVDPNYSKLPWAKTGLVGWGILLSVVPFLGCFLIGAAYVAIGNAMSKRSKTPSIVEVGLKPTDGSLLENASKLPAN